MTSPPVSKRAREARRDPTDREMLGEMIRGERRGFESRERPEFRALQSEGGSAVPTTFAEQVSVYARTLNPTLGSGPRPQHAQRQPADAPDADG